MLTEKDIEDPAVYINLHDLKSYTIQHLKTWLTYWGDSLKNVETLKEAQVKVLQYFKLGTEEKLIYPTPNKIWLSEKAKVMGLILKKENLKNLPNAPKDFVFYLSNLSLAGQKVLKECPYFLLNILTVIHKK